MRQKYQHKKIKLLALSIFTFINCGFFSIPQESLAVAPVTDVGAYAFFGSMSAELGIISGSTGANAGTTAGMSIWDSIEKYSFEGAMSALAKQAGLTLVNQITQEIVDWINSGYQGQPGFIADAGQFLTQTADQTIGNMIFNNPELNFLCEPFQLQVKTALGLNFGGYQPFKQEIGCTFSDVTENIEGAITGNNFLDSGGWDAWLQITTQPQNNQYGAYLIAKSKLEDDIATNKESKIQELNWGSGALGFNECTKVTTNQDGTIVESTTFKGNSSNEEIFPEVGSATMIEIKDCKPKTPGAVVTSMLGFKADSTGRMGEMQAAMANGIDSIISAAITQLLNAALDSIREGLLETDTTAQQDYSEYLSTLQSQIQETYNTQQAGISAGTFTTQSFFPEGFINQGTTSDSTIINTYDPLQRERWNSTLRLNSLIDSETIYQNNLKTTSNLLTAGREVFVTVRNCNVSYNNPTLYLRSTEIQANVITNIDGSGYQGIAPLDWNLEKIKNLLEISKNNLDILSSAGSMLMSATSSQGIVESMTQVNSTTFNTDPKSESIEYVKTWLIGKKNMYSVNPCIIDIDTAINTALASTTNP